MNFITIEKAIHGIHLHTDTSTEMYLYTWVPNAGVVELVELDGPFVKLRLAGRFWHERSMVLARLANYLQKRIPVSSLNQKA